MAVITQDDYLHALQGLLPHGPAWPRDADAPITRLLSGLSAELTRIDSRAEQLTREIAPLTTYEMLPDWERVAGLPSKCFSNIPTTTAERRAALSAKLTGTGGQSRKYFIDLAARLGFVITITEFDAYRVNSAVNSPMCSTSWITTWQINSALNTIRASTVLMAVNDPLRKWGNQLLECVIKDEKPGHTTVLFSYQ